MVKNIIRQAKQGASKDFGEKIEWDRNDHNRKKIAQVVGTPVQNE